MKYIIQEVIPKNFGARTLYTVKTNSGRFQCAEEELFETLTTNKGNELDLTIEDGRIIGIAGVETSKPAEESQPKSTNTRTTSSTPNSSPQVENEDAEEEFISGDDDIPQGEDTDLYPVNEKFPLLPKEWIKVRVQKTTTKGVALVLYIDARRVQEMLDAAYTPLGWKNSLRMVGDTLSCTIEVYDNERGWVGKEDVGTESNIEPEKGKASDSFKRAAVLWGVARELYTAPQIFVNASDTVLTPKYNDPKKFDCNDVFTVANIEYDDRRRIKTLDIYSRSKKAIVYRWRRK